MKLNWRDFLNIKFLKKINKKVTLHLCALVFIILFVYLGYNHYSQFREYLKYKKGKTQEKVPRQKVNPPSIKDFSMLKNKNIFDSGRGKKKTQPKKQKMDQFDILGVVKRNILYLVLEFKKDKKIKLFAEGEKINTNTLVEKLNLKTVTIRKGGRRTTHKISKIIDNKDLLSKKK